MRPQRLPGAAGPDRAVRMDPSSTNGWPTTRRCTKSAAPHSSTAITAGGRRRQAGAGWHHLAGGSGAGGGFDGAGVRMGLVSLPHRWPCRGFAFRCGRSHFLLRGQKKVTKEKATPGCRPSAPLRCSPPEAGLDSPWQGTQNVPAAELRHPAFFPRAARFSANTQGPPCIASAWRRGGITRERHRGLSPSALRFGARGGRERTVSELRSTGRFVPRARASWGSARRARQIGNRRAAMWGRLFFGYFLLAKQKK